MRHIVFISLLQGLNGFLFNSGPNVDQCYELDLENCFREAFLTAMHPPIRVRKSANNSTYTLDKRKGDSRHFLLCHDVRRMTACFYYPGCSDTLAASIASVQYHMVFGKKLPLHVFLAYRGFGKQMCEHSCNRDTVFICRRTMTKEEQDEEQNNLAEMTSLSSHISSERDNIGTCDRFRQSLTKVLRSRVRNCGDAARCTCEETLGDQATFVCGINCEMMLQQEQRAAINHSRRELLLFPVLAVFHTIFMF